MFRRLFLFFVFAVLFFSCKSQPAPIPDDISPDALLQMAQESIVKDNNNSHAIYYYNEFITRFGNDPALTGRIVEAEYEIGFIYFSDKQYAKAKEIFNSILEKYDNDAAQKLPRWPLALINKLMPEIEQHTSVTEEE